MDCLLSQANPINSPIMMNTPSIDNILTSAMTETMDPFSNLLDHQTSSDGQFEVNYMITGESFNLFIKKKI